MCLILLAAPAAPLQEIPEPEFLNIVAGITIALYINFLSFAHQFPAAYKNPRGLLHVKIPEDRLKSNFLFGATTVSRRRRTIAIFNFVHENGNLFQDLEANIANNLYGFLSV